MKRDYIDLTTDGEEESPNSNDFDRLPVGSALQGAIRMTQSKNAPNDRNKVRFEDVFQKRQLKKCVLTSFCVDFEWLLPHFTDISSVILCTDDGTHRSVCSCVTSGNISIVNPAFPKFPNYGVMHSKLMLLFYPTFLRLVISSGNLVSYDYDLVQNILFIQDLPLIDKSAEIVAFQSDTLALLRSLGIGEALVSQSELTAFDWTGIKVQMVTSRPGMYSLNREGSSLGLAKLSKCISLDNHVSSAFEVQGSSLGSMNGEWINNVKICLNGKRPTAHSDSNTSVLRIVFPTTSYVHNSPEGPEGFLTMFCNQKHWESLPAPLKTSLFHQGESAQGKGQALHAKIIAAFDKETSEPQWFYLGSANFTPSAWGKFVKEKSHIMMANYELGVFIPVECLSQMTPDGQFPFPYKRPLVPYSTEDTPWCQQTFLESN